MSFETAKKVIDEIFNNIPPGFDSVEIDLIGGEPLLEFDLLKDIVQYTCSTPRKVKFLFYATTNGTVLDLEMKEWFAAHKNCFVLGLSLDGQKDTHDYNRSNSFDRIDIDFFRRHYPEQGIKMTLSEYSLSHLAENIKYCHSLGFPEIGGVNLAEGDFNWDSDEFIDVIITQLSDLVEFYVENDSLKLNQMFDKKLSMCDVKNSNVDKWCGIGTSTVFFDIDGRKYPCPFVTPMTFNKSALASIMKTDFEDASCFVDNDCCNDCYIYPICPTCYGANYLVNSTFKQRDKRRCRIHKLIALFVADLNAKLIIKTPDKFDDGTLLHTINAIKTIRELYLPEFDSLI
jgi:sulfatase maturation enzyme AslB (radical SAM superfamily)